MLRALAEAGVRADLVVGTSIGAVNGAFVAADPDGAAARLSELWQGESLRMVFSENVLGRAVRLVQSGTHLHAIEPLRKMLTETLPAEDFADLKVPFHCVAASIEDATAHWFTSGPLVPAVMASCAVPGLLPPVEIDGRHYFDGGLVALHPGGPGDRARRHHHLRAARREDREPAPSTNAAVGGGACRLRDRAQAPVP